MHADHCRKFDNKDEDEIYIYATQELGQLTRTMMTNREDKRLLYKNSSAYQTCYTSR